MGLRGERGQVEVAERVDRRDVEAVRVECRTRARVRGKDERLAESSQPSDDAAQPLRADVRLAMDGDEEVAAGLDVEAHERVGALPCDRREAKACVGHDVSHHHGLAGHALGGEGGTRALVRTEQQAREPVDLDPVSLLRHVEVAAAQARLDVGKRRSGLLGGACPGESRVRVAVDERPVRPLGAQRFGDPRRHRVRVGGMRLEPVAGLAEPELVEEDLRELGVVVLPRMEHDLLDPVLAQSHRKRRRLDELRPVPDDGEHLHGAARLRAAPGR